jgi:hypothetical protein
MSWRGAQRRSHLHPIRDSRGPIVWHRLDAPLRATKPSGRFRITDNGLGTALRPAGRSCKTKPIWRWPTGIRGRIMQNKAKLGQGGKSGEWRDSEGPIMQNEPNQPIRAQVGTGRGTSPAGPSLALAAPNEPNLPPTGGEDRRQDRRPWRCHPSSGALRKTEPICIGSVKCQV